MNAWMCAACCLLLCLVAGAQQAPQGLPPDVFAEIIGAGPLPDGTYAASQSWEAESAGHRIGLETDALVDHDYDFHSNDRKWFWLERNRLAMVVRNYPGRLLALLAPALIGTEMVLLLVSARQGWLGAKLKGYRDLIGWLPRLRREREEIQGNRVISTRQFADLLTPDLDSPLIPGFARKGLVRAMLRTYWRAVQALLPG